MFHIIDPVSGLTISDSSRLGAILVDCPDHDQIQRALGQCILSASGWRSVFVESGDEEDTSNNVSAPGLILIAAMASVFADFLSRMPEKAIDKCCVLVATDSRPTGDLLADAMIRLFLAKGVVVRYISIAAAPEAMCYARDCPEVDGFAYISASHNPIGHNGLKFGLKTGGVLSGDEINPLIRDLRMLLSDFESCSTLRSLMLSVPAMQLENVFAKVTDYKRQSLQAYASFSDLVISDQPDPRTASLVLADLKQAIQSHPVGIVADLNGSARTLTIDREYFARLGVDIAMINDKPRQIAHRIVPEGHSLDQCRASLEQAYARNPAFVLGYVPDNDGDRGNFVYIDEKSGSAHSMEAQEVFALCCLAEFSFGARNEKSTQEKLAIAINDPTSMRIDEIAGYFGIEVYRAEVGEANVVNLANSLRSKGFRVRILGEGSNGGNITHPAAVRDPLNSIASLLKLLCLRNTSAGQGLFAIWCSRIGLPYDNDFRLIDIIRSLPTYTTTSAYEDRAILRITTTDHALLKAKYEAVFQIEWLAKRQELAEQLRIKSWEILNYEGINETKGLGARFRSGLERGGLKVLFRDHNQSPVAFLWMRGSGTEPVFRVSVDLKGDNPELEAWLLAWHVSMIKQADQN